MIEVNMRSAEFPGHHHQNLLVEEEKEPELRNAGGDQPPQVRLLEEDSQTSLAKQQANSLAAHLFANVNAA